MINEEAIGYAVGALYRKLTEEGKSFEEKHKRCSDLADEMYRFFDFKTEDEAYKIGKQILRAQSENDIEPY